MRLKDVYKRQVYISGAQHTPPSPYEMYRKIKDFYADLTWKGREMNPIELAAWTHAEFVKIHPFPDGNGRTSRLIKMCIRDRQRTRWSSFWRALRRYPSARPIFTILMLRWRQWMESGIIW